MARFNPPPNWPPPPPGWEPGPGWRPNPDWGPPPPGWELWIPEPRDRRRRANSAAFGRVGVVAIVVLVALLLTQGAAEGFSEGAFGFALGVVFLPWVVVSVVVFFSRKRWSWLAIAGMFLGVALLRAVLSSAG